MNHIFSNIIGNLNTPQYKDPTTNTNEISDHVIKSVEKFKNHLIIPAIIRNGPYDTFSFSKVNKKPQRREKSHISSKSNIP